MVAAIQMSLAVTADRAAAQELNQQPLRLVVARLLQVKAIKVEIPYIIRGRAHLLLAVVVAQVWLEQMVQVHNLVAAAQEQRLLFLDLL